MREAACRRDSRGQDDTPLCGYSRSRTNRVPAKDEWGEVKSILKSIQAARLKAALIDDIEAVFPTKSGSASAARGSVFLMANPRAPIISVSRDPHMGQPLVVPHFFLACSSVELLQELGTTAFEYSHGQLVLS